MDYKNPNYYEEYERRAELLKRLRANPGMLPGLKMHYKANPIDFVRDWATTSDPRNIEKGLPALTPFIPFPKQIEWMQWLLDRIYAGENGLTEKTRDMGCTVTFMALACTLAIFNNDFVAGVGSRKESLIDGVGDPNTIMYKGEIFMRYLPHEFAGGYRDGHKVHRSHMKIWIPQSNGVIIGEAGDNIGRGGRTTITLLDESAHNRNQASIDMALSQTTRCRIDLSSANGSDNTFYEKRTSGRVPVFTFGWRDDPRKGQDWYDRECARLPPVIVAQEIDINYNASKDNILIPSDWVQAAMDAHLVIAGSTTLQVLGLDVADTGNDVNATARRQGILLNHLSEWSGNGSDIFETGGKAALLADSLGVKRIRYDGDGLGAGLRGDFRVLNDSRGEAQIEAIEHRGSGAVVDPEDFAIDPDHKNGHEGRKNKDFFENYKAQSWWTLRQRFERTFKWVRQGIKCDPDLCISIDSTIPLKGKLTQELSQPTYKTSTTGKILVVKQPTGTKSPNIADAVVIAYAPEKRETYSWKGF